ncbi:MAG TPA: sialidase family protein [Candidatus Thermoplasmatota archaeon]|nr:sialidase family protein [Candidatus Thermoplasmatota archaeon]
MRILGALALASLLLAGCLSQPSNPTGATDPSQVVRDLPKELKSPVALPELKLGFGAGEPNIAIAPDGTIYVTPVDHVYRSKDGGKTFQGGGTGVGVAAQGTDIYFGGIAEGTPLR